MRIFGPAYCTLGEQLLFCSIKCFDMVMYELYEVNMVMQ